MAVNVTGLQLKSFQTVPDWRMQPRLHLCAPAKRSGRAITGTRGEGSREVEGSCAGVGAGALAYFLGALSGVWRNEQAGVGAGGHEAVQRLPCRIRRVVHHEQEFQWPLCTPRLSPSASRITSLQPGSLDSSQLVLPKLIILHMTLIHLVPCAQVACLILCKSAHCILSWICLTSATQAPTCCSHVLAGSVAGGVIRARGAGGIDLII